MKNLNPYFFFIFFILLLSCDDKNLPDNIINQDKIILSELEYISIAYDNPQEISDIDAVKIAKDFVSNVSSTTETRSDIKASISKKYYIGNDLMKNQTRSANYDENSIPIYEISLGDDLAYVSADERVPEVIAYLSKNNKKGIREDTGPDYMLKLSEIAVLETIEFYKYIKDSLRTQTLEKIGQKLDIISPQLDDIKEQIIVNRTDDITARLHERTFGPYVKVEWEQGYPYNCKLPMIPGIDIEDFRYPTGCGATAVAQILSAMKPSMTVKTDNASLLVDWNYLNETLKITAPDPWTGSGGSPEAKRNMIGYLMKDIYYGIKSETIGTNVFDYQSYSNISDARQYLSKYCKVFKIERLSLFEKNYIIQNLQIGGLVYMRADNENEKGHAWVLDGLFAETPLSGVDRFKPVTYVHANFGFSGESNGYFKFTVGGIAFPLGMNFQTIMGNFNKNIYVFRVRKK